MATDGDEHEQGPNALTGQAAAAEEAAAAFASEADRFVYSRYGNPTVSMLQTRLAALEGAEACLATGTGMAGVFAALACQPTRVTGWWPAARCSVPAMRS